MTAARRRLIADQVRDRFGVSQRRVSRVLDLARSSIRYTPVVSDDRAALARRIEALSGIHPRFGYRRIWVMLDREGWSANKKTVRRASSLASARAEIGRETGQDQASPTSWPGCERLPSPALAGQGRRLDLGLHLRPDQRRPEPEVVELD